MSSRIKDYVILNKGTPWEGKLCIGEWDEHDKYSPLNRDDLDFHLQQRYWEDEPGFPGGIPTKRIAPPPTKEKAERVRILSALMSLWEKLDSNERGIAPSLNNEEIITIIRRYYPNFL